MWRSVRLPRSALATVARKSFKWQIYCKNCFSDWAFYVTIADADIGSLKSLYTLFDKYLDHMLVTVKIKQNRMVQTIQNFVLFDKKWLTIFDKVLTPFWKKFLWLKQFFVAKILTLRLSFFNVPKITALRHVKLHQTWQTWSVSTKTYHSRNLPHIFHCFFG